VTFDPAAGINLVIYILATFGSMAGVYYGIRGDIKELRKDIQITKDDTEQAALAIKEVLRDYEVRLRVLERSIPHV
jgi:hypothetical protein